MITATIIERTNYQLSIHLIIFGALRKNIVEKMHFEKLES
jgi:hypothetical protein